MLVDPEHFPPKRRPPPIRLVLRLALVSFLVASVSCQAGSEPTAPESQTVKDLAVGEYESPFRLDGRGVSPANHLGPFKLEIVPSNPPTDIEFAFPFGNNVNFGFTGFVYRNVAAFTLQVGDVIAFDLRAIARDGLGAPTQVRHNIYFATASANPQTCGQVVSAASGWTQVVSQNQTPQNPMGDTVTGNFELRFIAEAPFVFPGGGFLVGFETSPPAPIAQCCIASFPPTTCLDPDGRFHSRFFFLPNLTTGPLTGDNVGIGGIAILEPGGTGTCAAGVSEARSRIAQLLPNRPFLRFLLNLLLTRMQGGAPNAEGNFGALLDFLAQRGVITAQDSADLQSLVDPC